MHTQQRRDWVGNSSDRSAVPHTGLSELLLDIIGDKAVVGLVALRLLNWYCPFVLVREQWHDLG
jgi:hypothetical protein